MTKSEIYLKFALNCERAAAANASNPAHAQKSIAARDRWLTKAVEAASVENGGVGDTAPASVEHAGDSIVRRNLMERRDYSPYCGADVCSLDMPRTRWDGEQFRCRCGWRSSFEPEFVAAFKAKWDEEKAK